MEVSTQDLREQYESMEDGELLDLYRSGNLTEVASAVLCQVLELRGIGASKLSGLVSEEEKRDIEILTPSSPFPKVWIGYIIAALWLAFAVGEVVIDPSSIDRTSPGLVVIAFGGWIYWLFCVHRIHWVLAEATDNHYPIQPMESAGYHAIPLFNFYWIFRWTSQLADFVNDHAQERVMAKGLPGSLLLLGWLLGVLFGSTIGLAINFGVLSYILGKLRGVLAVPN